jgi:hypothetical protein
MGKLGWPEKVGLNQAGFKVVSFPGPLPFSIDASCYHQYEALSSFLISSSLTICDRQRYGRFHRRHTMKETNHRGENTLLSGLPRP